MDGEIVLVSRMQIFVQLLSQSIDIVCSPYYYYRYIDTIYYYYHVFHGIHGNYCPSISNSHITLHMIIMRVLQYYEKRLVINIHRVIQAYNCFRIYRSDVSAFWHGYSCSNQYRCDTNLILLKINLRNRDESVGKSSSRISINSMNLDKATASLH